MGESKVGHASEESRPGRLDGAARSVVPVLQRLPEQIAASVRRHDIEARAALRKGLVELEERCERRMAEEVREALEEVAGDGRGGVALRTRGNWERSGMPRVEQSRC